MVRSIHPGLGQLPMPITESGGTSGAAVGRGSDSGTDTSTRGRRAMEAEGVRSSVRPESGPLHTR